jgi:hypothetical protein
MGKSKMGMCRLCGKHKKLSFEHIPPRSAYNNKPLLVPAFLGPGLVKIRRGLGQQSLCVDCNNNTGGMYGGAFVEWSQQGFDAYTRLKQSGESAITDTFHIKPLNVLKQVIVMSLAMAPVGAVSKNRSLREYVLDKTQRQLPVDDLISVYYSIDGKPRFSAGVGALNISNNSGSFIRAEVALPPFGYLVSSPMPGRIDLSVAQGLCAIGHFADYEYDAYADIELHIPAKETHLQIPADYRTQEQIKEHMERNARES